MPIPVFDGILNVLPPHLGDPRAINDLSPYACTTLELCQRFATTPARKQILEGFLGLRAALVALGIQGFQWLDGSFVEDIEAQEGRDPGDIDVVTFVANPADPAAFSAVVTGANPDLLNRPHVKATYHVDHFWMPLGSHPDRIVASTRYWYGLFSHRRDQIWKGMLVVELPNAADDAAARTELGSHP
jgi:hypothetical protein